MQLASHFRRVTRLALVLVVTVPSLALAQHHHAGIVHAADSGLNTRISRLVEGSPTLRALVDRAALAGMRIHVFAEGPLPDHATAVLTTVEGKSGATDVVVRLDASASDSRLAETLEHEIGHALANPGGSAAAHDAPLTEALGRLGLLADSGL